MCVCVHMTTHVCGNQRGLLSLYRGGLTEGTQAWWVPHFPVEPSFQSHLVIGAASGRHLALGRPEEKLASSPIVGYCFVCLFVFFL